MFIKWFKLHMTVAVCGLLLILHNRVLYGERPYWWVNENSHYQLTQFPLTCETGPGILLTLLPVIVSYCVLLNWMFHINWQLIEFRKVHIFLIPFLLIKHKFCANTNWNLLTVFLLKYALYLLTITGSFIVHKIICDQINKLQMYNFFAFLLQTIMC